VGLAGCSSLNKGPTDDDDDDDDDDDLQFKVAVT